MRVYTEPFELRSNVLNNLTYDDMTSGVYSKWRDYTNFRICFPIAVTLSTKEDSMVILSHFKTTTYGIKVELFAK